MFFFSAGHLTFQCFNTEGASAVIDEVESTTSDSEAEMQQLEAQLKEKRRQEEGDYEYYHWHGFEKAEHNTCRKSLAILVCFIETLFY